MTNGERRSFRRQRVVLILALAVTATLEACGNHSSPRRGPEAAQQDTAEAGRQAGAEEQLGRMPAFTLKDTSGREVSSEQFRGKVLLVDFWATWCAPCKQEMPGYEDLYRRYHHQGFVVVGIAMDWDGDAVTKFARKLDVTYPLLLNGANVQQQFGILGLPTTLLVDREGRIRKKVVGFEYKEAIETALKQVL